MSFFFPCNNPNPNQSYEQANTIKNHIILNFQKAILQCCIVKRCFNLFLKTQSVKQLCFLPSAHFFRLLSAVCRRLTRVLEIRATFLLMDSHRYDLPNVRFLVEHAFGVGKDNAWLMNTVILQIFGVVLCSVFSVVNSFTGIKKDT